MRVGTAPLAAEAQLLDEGAVALEVLALQVVQKATAATDQLQQAFRDIGLKLSDLYLSK